MSAPVHSGKRVSHYAVGECLGAGGMGVVYRATDLRLGRPVALKFLRPMSDPAMRRRLLREAQAASSLDHPNLCTIFEIDEAEDGDIFIAMALYEGETLDRVLAKGPLEIERALAIAVQAGRGLSAAHEDLVIHRDIKPANLMLTRGDTVKILDFGVAVALDEPSVGSRRVAAGTPAYMSPEQLRGEPVDQRTDIWSLGATLYEMIAGRPPFRRDNMAAVIQAILHDAPPPASALRGEVPGPVDRVIAKALTKDVRLRYRRMETMVQDLVRLQSDWDGEAITLEFPAAAAKSSIAVLPFEDMSPERDQGFLCDGIAEEILRALSRIPDLFVASRTSAFQFKRNPSDIREIGSRLNVATLLEGSVRRVGDRVRVSAQLISVESGYRLWSETYDRYLEDIFAIEDEIAEQIAHALEVTLVPARKRSSAGRSAGDAEAYQLYLQGRQFFHQHRRKGFEIALQIFTQVIELDPRYAPAYAGIADCHSFLRLYFGAGLEAITAADAASAKALELDPELSDAHASRGLALFLRRDFDGAERRLRKAIELDPWLYDPHYVFGRVCFSRGRYAEAATHYREACTIVPEAFGCWYLLGMAYRKMGRTAKARNADLECIEAVKKRVRYHPDDTRAWTMGAAVLAGLGEPELATQWIERALAIDPDESIIVYNAACVYTALHKHDRAFDCLNSVRTGLSRDWIENDPDLDPLREDIRFQDLLRRLGD